MTKMVFLSFLGASEYLPCTYYYDDMNGVRHQYEGGRYIQEALLHIFKDKLKGDASVGIVMTEISKEKNWEGEGKLKEIIEKNFSFLKVTPLVISSNTPNVMEEILDLFRIFYDFIPSDSRVILDITHAFRFMPAVGLVGLNYSRFLKHISIEGIYYGAFERLGSPREVQNIPVEQRLVPIYDLSLIETILQWSNAAHEFVSTGDGRDVANLLRVKGMLFGEEKQAEHLAQLLEQISYQFATCRGKELVKAKEIMDLKSTLESMGDKFPAVYKPLFLEMRRSFEDFRADDVVNILRAVEWCLRYDLIQQGFTFLEEFIITYLLSQLKRNYEKMNNRTLLNKALNAVYNIQHKSSIDVSDVLETMSAKERTSQMRDLVKDLLKLPDLRLWARSKFLTGRFRNDINHAGSMENAKESKNFRSQLGDELNRVKKLVNSTTADDIFVNALGEKLKQWRKESE